MADTSEYIARLEAENAALRRHVSELRQREATQSFLHAAVIFGLPLPVVLYHPDGTLIAQNRAHQQLFCIVFGEDATRYNILSDSDAHEAIFRDAFMQARDGTVHKTPPTQLFLQQQERRTWVEAIYFPIFAQSGELVVIGEVLLDVDAQMRSDQERDQALAALAERERRLRVIFENSALGIALVTPEGVTIAANPAMSRLLEYPIDELIGRRVMTRTHPDDVLQERDLFADLIAGRLEQYRIDKRYVRRDGAICYVRLTSTPVLGNDGVIEGVVRMVEDITAQREAQTSEQVTRDLLATLIEQIPALIFIKDRLGRYQIVNRAFAAISGHTPEQMIGRTDEELIGIEAAQIYNLQNAEVIRSQKAYSFENTHEVAGETRYFASIKFPLYNRGQEVYALGNVAIDITAKKQAEVARQVIESRLRETQKLESLGLMAGGVAHDFNNLLVAIMGNASLALDELPQGSPVEESLRQIEVAARRAADLTRQLLAYAGKGRVSTSIIQLNELIREMTSLLRASIPRSVALHMELDAHLPLVEVDPTQIRQVLMNLVINAGEAIQSGAGAVTIRSEVVHVDGDSLARLYMAPDLQAGPYVRIAVRDTGEGITPEVRRRIFEPFFTTKFTGRGLGLAAVLGIIRGHHGAINVYSEPGQGSLFSVLLPVTDSVDLPLPPLIEPHPLLLHGTVLLVDDESDVRNVACHMLKRLGFVVHEAVDAAAALALAEQFADELRFALLDVTMPGVGGEELALALRARLPHLRVLLMSGYSEHVAADRIGTQIHGFLAKPFVMSELEAAIRKMLDL